MTATLEWTQSNVQQNIEQLQTPKVLETERRHKTIYLNYSCSLHAEYL